MGPCSQQCAETQWTSWPRALGPDMTTKLQVTLQWKLPQGQGLIFVKDQGNAILDGGLHQTESSCRTSWQSIFLRLGGTKGDWVIPHSVINTLTTYKRAGAPPRLPDPITNQACLPFMIITQFWRLCKVHIFLDGRMLIVLWWIYRRQPMWVILVNLIITLFSSFPPSFFPPFLSSSLIQLVNM